MSKQNDQLHDKWKKWLEHLSNEVIELHTNRHIFLDVQDIIRQNPIIHQPGDFNVWVAKMYGSAMSVAVRRQAINDEKSISFRCLLEEIKANPKVMSRTRFKNSFVDANYPEFMANRRFDELARAGREYLDTADIDNEIQTLIGKTAKLHKYVNKHVAHHDRKEFTEIPTFGDLHEAIDYLEELLRKYCSLFTAFHISVCLRRHNDWRDVFRFPWLTPGYTVPKYDCD
jgi:AbiU2